VLLAPSNGNIGANFDFEWNNYADSVHAGMTKILHAPRPISFFSVSESAQMCRGRARKTGRKNQLCAAFLISTLRARDGRKKKAAAR
jgi:hypothetical protein